MIRVYRPGHGFHQPAEADLADWSTPDDTMWIDMVDPTPAEDRAVETALNLSVPTRAEMSELEASSRLYRESGAAYVTADIIHHGDDDVPSVDPVTFVLTRGPLVTIRYFDPKPFAMMIDKLEREPRLCATGSDLFLNLMEAIIDRASDVLAKNTAKVEAVSTHVFAERKAVGFDRLIAKLGQAHIANARIEQSLSSLSRIFAFVSLNDAIEQDAELRGHLKSLSRDALSLIGHNQSVAASINFQLSAALGLINIQQSSIVKVFSVFTVVLMPPTLIGAIYGMNFEHMPELRWIDGYPLALAAMVVSGVLPLWFFRRKGWL